MDIETVYLFLGVILLSSFMLVVLRRSFKNKSYEEVIAEQRQQTNALFSNQQKPKIKDKKQKKALKKSKEKKVPETTTDEVTEDGSEHADESAKEEIETVEVHKANVHVEFKEPTVIEEPVKETKRKQRRESVKPILVNRDSSSELINKEANVMPLTNHFAESHPKDEFELLNAHITQMQHNAKEETANAKNEKKKKQPVPDKKCKHQVNEIISKTTVEKVLEVKPKEEVKEEPPKEEPLSFVTQNGVAAGPPKDKKKKKSEINVLTQSNEKLGVNVSHLITLVRKTDMSKQDVQTLIDVLLNKQQDAPSVINEWSEGKGDPMQKLKKQLAEKSQLTTELQDTLTGTQNKLREIRAEHLNERSQLMQNIRELQERLNVMKLEKQTLDHKFENVSIKCRQLQDAANEDAAKHRQMMEEYTAMNMQIQQVEAHIAKTREDALTIDTLSTDLATLVSQRAIDNQGVMRLNKQIALAKEECDTKDHHIREFLEMKGNFENKVIVLNNDKQQLNNELQMLHEKMRGIEMNKERDLQTLQKQAEDANKEATKTKNDFRLAINETHLIQEKLAHAVDDINKLQEECTKHMNISKITLQEKHKLQEELQKLQEAKTNGSIEMDKQHQLIINQLHTDLKNVKNQLEQNDEGNKSKLGMLKKQYDTEIEELRNKNNDLRKKNWKVMEALNAAEYRAKSSISSNAHNPNQISDILVKQIRSDERDLNKKFFKRLFPSIEVSASLSQEQWEETIEHAVQEYIRNLTASKTSTPPEPATPVPETKVHDDESEVAKLRLQVSNYEKIIGDTEGILCKLQTQVEEEQIRWRRELKIKEDSIVLLNEQLEIKEGELRTKIESLNEASTNSHTSNGPTACINESVPHLPSSDSSAASSVADLNEKKNKKKKKKKNKDTN